MRGLVRVLHSVTRRRLPPAPPPLRLVFFPGHEKPELVFAPGFVPSIRNLSLTVQQQQQLSWDNGSSTADILLAKLETAVTDHDPDVAWVTLCDYKRLYGFPRKFVVSRLVGMLSYASANHWLHKAYELVLSIIDEKGELPYDNSLIRLSMVLARAQVPVPAATILRLLLEKDEFLSLDICKMVLFHMVKTEVGSCLAANILIEICECFLKKRMDRNSINRLKLMKPDTTLFNIVLSSCVHFGSSLKAQQLIDLMWHIGIVADANSINIIACVYEMNGQREDMMNLEEHVSSVSSLSLHKHYKKFYDCLLSLHFKFNDMDAASVLMIGMLKNSTFLDASDISTLENKVLEKLHEIQVGSRNLKIGYKIMAKPEQLPGDFVFQSLNSFGLVIVKRGKLVPSSKALAKLINGYVREKRIGDLSNFITSIHKEVGPFDGNDVCLQVVDACIQVGWLEVAHDILENLEAKVPISFSTYKSLFGAYHTKDRLKEAKLLVKQIKKYFPMYGGEAQAMSLCLAKEATANIVHTEPAKTDEKSQLLEFLGKEIVEDTKAQVVYELNSSIFFFCKAKMMEDAMRTLKKMQQRNVLITVQTFVHLVNGYSSLQMYREITILWGEIKRRMEDGILTANRDLLDSLLWNFIRGGYFERVMEVIHYMTEHNVYVDKWMYKREFLAFHRSLYQNLKSSDASTDAQKKRLEHVQAFRRWAGIGVKSFQNFR